MMEPPLQPTMTMMRDFNKHIFIQKRTIVFFILFIFPFLFFPTTSIENLKSKSNPNISLGKFLVYGVDEPIGGKTKKERRKEEKRREEKRREEKRREEKRREEKRREEKRREEKRREEKRREEKRREKKKRKERKRERERGGESSYPSNHNNSKRKNKQTKKKKNRKRVCKRFQNLKPFIKTSKYIL